MAPAEPDDVLAEAIAWRLRLESEDADWGAYVDWLEADPAHSDAVDCVDAADAAMLGATFPAPSAVDAGSPRDGVGRRRWIGGLAAIAATALAVVAAFPMISSGTDRYAVTTAPGEQRRVEIADGSYAMLNGATRLILDRNDPRFAELADGEATFTVRHDAAAPFTVVAGSHRVRDVGTTFNLIRERGDLTVEVIEGSVVYNPDSEAIRLTAGTALHASSDGHPRVASTDPQMIADWRRGQLSYAAAPLEQVASDMSRTLGVPIAVDDAVAAQQLTGSIRIRSDVAATIGDFALVADVAARRDGNRWIIEPRAPR